MAVFRKLVVRFVRGTADVAVFQNHFRADPADQEGAVEGLWDAWWEAIRQHFTPGVMLSEYRWYFAGDPPPFHPDEWGPADRQQPRVLFGTSVSNSLPPQCSIVVTKGLGAPAARHQGRFYIPHPSVATVDATGRLQAAVVTGIAGATKTLYDACKALGYQPCILARVQESPAVYHPSFIRVDNDVDTQRRRAHDSATFTETRTPAVGSSWGPT